MHPDGGGACPCPCARDVHDVVIAGGRGIDAPHGPGLRLDHARLPRRAPGAEDIGGAPEDAVADRWKGFRAGRARGTC
ncbi:hypothetical protein EES45_09635 [Streptomyces sp. ADI97-07]|nr:hypothetical protein EES45_09635 [Streptomyces sp. ADI97-07]